MQDKKQLLQECESYINNRQKTIETTIASLQNDLNSETKSSAGDKHETGRAMIQLEMEKAGKQLASIQQSKEILARIDGSKKSSIASLGSLIETNHGIYFLCISLGHLKVEGKTYLVISTSSPIGKLLLGKKTGESIVWNGREIKIHNIS